MKSDVWLYRKETGATGVLVVPQGTSVGQFAPMLPKDTDAIWLVTVPRIFQVINVALLRLGRKA